MNKKRNKKRAEPVVDTEELTLETTPAAEEIMANPEPLVKGLCPLCKGTRQMLGVGKHVHTNIMKTFSIPCMCYVSTTVSSQYKLLKHLGDQYMHPDKLDPQLSPDFKNLPECENYILTGNYEALLTVIKSLIMKHRFELHPPNILFSRSIDIVHDYHVPQDDGVSLHLSETSKFDLAIIIFGSNERNQAIAPCMAQMVSTRLDEQKPTWIYFPETMPTLTPNSQEYSADLSILLDRKFKKIGIKTDLKLAALESHTKRSVTRF